MQLIFRKAKGIGARGDTIIEVMVTLAILGLAFGISYATANRSLLLARNAQEHSEALQDLNSQVELVRADSADPTLFLVTPGMVFCMDPATDLEAASASSSFVSVSTTTGCVLSGPEGYTEMVTYAPSPVGGVNEDLFTFQIDWSGVGDLGPQHEQIEYKVHEL
jgi:prepilin-type N-terminal cleavage/methylation domain-containing protein